MRHRVPTFNRSHSDAQRRPRRWLLARAKYIHSPTSHSALAYNLRLPACRPRLIEIQRLTLSEAGNQPGYEPDGFERDSMLNLSR